MKIGGFLKQSFIDFPGNIASVIFTSGCNFRCFYCHNPDLVLPEKIKENQIIEESEILDYLFNNKSLLDAVVITGGEPTIHQDLPEFIKKIKELDLLVKLDTNGTNPELIKFLINNRMVDYIAMDIKSGLSLEKYKALVGEQFKLEEMNKVKESINLIMQSGIRYEFRTTLIQPFHSFNDIREISSHLTGDYYLQQFRPINGKHDCITLDKFDREEVKIWKSRTSRNNLTISLRTN